MSPWASAKVRRRSVNGWAKSSVQKTKTQMWIPEGFAHGFVVLTDVAKVLYNTTDYRAPEHERCIAWNEKTLAISRSTCGEPILSGRQYSVRRERRQQYEK
jgi:dTDP-4-dehydrorhamnose 3,5-epimerase